MKKRIAVAIVILMVLLMGMGVMHARASTTVCTRTGLTGAAHQENDLYCGWNGTVFTLNIASSTYNAAIDLAQAKNIVVGVPKDVYETVDWAGTPITDVEFSRGYHAEHYNPSGGHVRIYYNNVLVWSE